MITQVESVPAPECIQRGDPGSPCPVQDSASDCWKRGAAKAAAGSSCEGLYQLSCDTAVPARGYLPYKGECYLQLALWSMGKCTCESREQIEKTMRASSRVCVKSIKPSQSNHWLSAGLSFKMISQPQRLQKSKGSFPQSP